MAMTVAYIYESPYRPLDLHYAAVPVDWANTDIGNWTPRTRYAFVAELPASFVSQWDLRRVD